MDSAQIAVIAATAAAEVLIYALGQFRAALSRPSRRARLNLSN